MDFKIPVNGMYLTRDDYKEWHDLFSEMYPNGDKVRKENKTLTSNITFVVTERCNLRCTYCYESHEAHACGKKMTKEVGKRGVDMILNDTLLNGYFSKEENPGLILEFIGGEPLLEIDLMDYITDYFKIRAFELNHPWATNYMISISSNGLLFNSEKVQKYLDKNKGHVSMTITIDGNKELHDSCRLLPNGEGSYDIVEKSVINSVKLGYGDNTKITLAPENLDFIPEAFKNTWGLGIRVIYSNCVYENVWKLEDSTKLYYKLKEVADYLIDNKLYDTLGCSLFDEGIGVELVDTKNYCGGNGSMLAIGPDGVCYPCLRYMEHSMKNKRKLFTCGDIYNGLENKDTNKSLCELCSVDMLSQSDEECKNCNVGSGCGLCTAFNYDEFGTPNKRAKYTCNMHRGRVLVNAYYWNKLYISLGIERRFTLNLDRDVVLTIISESEYDMLKDLEV